MLNPDEDYFNGLTPNDMLSIAKLATEHIIDWEHYAKKHLEFSVLQQTPNPRNDFSNLKYALMDIPVKTKKGEYFPGYELKFFEDGFISFENGFDVQLKFSNPLECYKILSQKLKI